MAINIFSGGASRAPAKTNSASASSRARAAKAALATPSETSDSGTTAVGTKGTLSKVANTANKVLGVASKFLPGPVGAIAKIGTGILGKLSGNDPEWWQQVPGDALTLNEPLRFTKEFEGDFQVKYTTGEGPLATDVPTFNQRAAILDISSFLATRAKDNFEQDLLFVDTPRTEPRYPFTATEQMVTQYLMPEIRKVVNAVPLQDAYAYKVVLQSAVAIYAIWRQLKKIDYLCKHGQTYLANMNDVTFPLCQTSNAAWLQSTINRLEEYLRANIRLPHTMCEYLAWRYGRVYKSNSSAKSALVLYNVINISAKPEVYDLYINGLMNVISSSPEYQKANADMFNAYFDHDIQVEIADASQFCYDPKEFLLRQNLQTGTQYSFSAVRRATPTTVLDSNLDNPTTFMASTVSSIGKGQDQNFETLFQVAPEVSVYIPSPERPSNIKPTDNMCISLATGGHGHGDYGLMYLDTEHVLYEDAYALRLGTRTDDNADIAVGEKSSLWMVGHLRMDPNFYDFGSVWKLYQSDNPTAEDYYAVTTLTALYAECIKFLILGRAVDLYNVCAYVPAFLTGPDNAVAEIDFHDQLFLFDGTSLACDAGKPTLATMNTEHVYAFANLVDMGRKSSMSYRQAERMVAKDTANLVDSLDVATVATKV